MNISLLLIKHVNILPDCQKLDCHQCCCMPHHSPVTGVATLVTFLATIQAVLGLGLVIIGGILSSNFACRYVDLLMDELRITIQFT
jgi:hypothetical protein